MYVSVFFLEYQTLKKTENRYKNICYAMLFHLHLTALVDINVMFKNVDCEGGLHRKLIKATFLKRRISIPDLCN